VLLLLLSTLTLTLPVCIAPAARFVTATVSHSNMLLR